MSKSLSFFHPLGALRRVNGGIAARPTLMRWIMGGPVCIIASFLIMMGMAYYIPPGAAKLNNIAIPLVIAPLIWVIVFTYVCVTENVTRMVWVVSGITIVHFLILAFRMKEGLA